MNISEGGNGIGNIQSPPNSSFEIQGNIGEFTIADSSNRNISNLPITEQRNNIITNPKSLHELRASLFEDEIESIQVLTENVEFFGKVGSEKNKYRKLKAIDTSKCILEPLNVASEPWSEWPRKTRYYRSNWGTNKPLFLDFFKDRKACQQHTEYQKYLLPREYTQEIEIFPFGEHCRWFGQIEYWSWWDPEGLLGIPHDQRGAEWYRRVKEELSDYHHGGERFGQITEGLTLVTTPIKLFDTLLGAPMGIGWYSGHKTYAFAIGHIETFVGDCSDGYVTVDISLEQFGIFGPPDWTNPCNAANFTEEPILWDGIDEFFPIPEIRLEILPDGANLFGSICDEYPDGVPDDPAELYQECRYIAIYGKLVVDHGKFFELHPEKAEHITVFNDLDEVIAPTPEQYPSPCYPTPHGWL